MKPPLDLTSPLIWLAGNLVLAILTPQLVWLALCRRAPRVRANRDDLVPVSWLAVSLFFLLPPAGAWWCGALSPRLMGLTEVDWIADLAAGGGIATLIVGLTLFGWMTYRRSIPGGRARTRPERISASVRAACDAALQQWHWAFYRALATAYLALTAAAWPPPSPNAAGIPSLDWGSWLGMGFVAIEAALNPFDRAALWQPGPREALLRRIALAIATTALFTLTGNLWLCLACDIAIETAIAAWFALPKQTGPAPSLEEPRPATL